MYLVFGFVKIVYFWIIFFNVILFNKRYLLIWYIICFLKDKEIILFNRNYMKIVFLIIIMLCFGLLGMV